MAQALTPDQLNETRRDFFYTLDKRCAALESLLMQSKCKEKLHLDYTGFGKVLTNHLKRSFEMFITHYNFEESKELVYALISINKYKLKVDVLLRMIFSKNNTLLIERLMCLPSNHQAFKGIFKDFKRGLAYLEKYYLEHLDSQQPKARVGRIEFHALRTGGSGEHSLAKIVADTKTKQENMFIRVQKVADIIGEFKTNPTKLI